NTPCGSVTRQVPSQKSHWWNSGAAQVGAGGGGGGGDAGGDDAAIAGPAASAAAIAMAKDFMSTSPLFVLAAVFRKGGAGPRHAEARNLDLTEKRTGWLVPRVANLVSVLATADCLFAKRRQSARIDRQSKDGGPKPAARCRVASPA